MAGVGQAQPTAWCNRVFLAIWGRFSGTAADQSTRPMRAVPELGCGSAAAEAGALAIKHSSPLAWYSSALIPEAHVEPLEAGSHQSLLWLLCGSCACIQPCLVTVTQFSLSLSLSQLLPSATDSYHKGGPQDTFAFDKWSFGICGHFCPHSLSQGCRKPSMCAGVSAFLSLWDTSHCFIFCCCSLGTNLSLVTSAHFIKKLNKPFPGDGVITSYSLKYISSTFELALYDILLLCMLCFFNPSAVCQYIKCFTKAYIL